MEEAQIWGEPLVYRGLCRRLQSTLAAAACAAPLLLTIMLAAYD